MKKRAFIKYTEYGKIIPGSMIVTQGSFPSREGRAKWYEVPMNKCCDYEPQPPIDLELFLSRMNSCYRQVTGLVPSITYFSDSSDGNGNTSIADGCNDMYDGANMYNTNHTQLYNNIKGNNTDPYLSIPYTHTQYTANWTACDYTNPPMDGTIADGSSYFGSGSQYFTNMYPGMFLIAATGVNIKEFSITGNIGTDGDATDAIYVDTAHPGWKAYIKTNLDNSPEGDPSINHIILVNGDVSGVTQLYDNTGSEDDHCLKGLGPQNSTIITAVVSTTSATPVLLEEEAVRIANAILDVYNNPCDGNYTLKLLFNDINNANALVGDSSNVNDWNTFFDLPNYGSPFTSVVIDGNEVQLLGGYNIETKYNLFYDVSSLLEVDDNGAIVILGDQSFPYDGYITSFKASNVIKIKSESLENYGPFGENVNLTTIYLPKCINIEANAFYGVNNLTLAGFTLPFDQITRISDYAFGICTSLKEANFPSLKYIFGAYSFELYGNDVNATKLYFPSLLQLGTDCGNNTVFSNLISNQEITLTVPSALMTCNSGDPDGDITYLQDYNTVTIITV